MTKRKSSSDNHQPNIKRPNNDYIATRENTEVEKLTNQVLAYLSDLNENKSKTIIEKTEKNLKELINEDSKNSTHTLFEAIMNVLFNSLPANSSNHAIDCLLSCINKINIKPITIDVCKHLDLVNSFMLKSIEHTDKPCEYLRLKIDSIVIKFAQAVLSSSENIAEIDIKFFRFVKESDLTEKILLELLSLSNSNYHQSHSNLVVLIIESLLGKKSIDRFPNEFLEASIFESIKACHKFSLIKSWSIVYEKSIEIILAKRENIKEKKPTFDFEKKVIQLFINSVNKSKHSSQSFLTVFQKVITKSMNDSVILDRFLLCLYFMIENSITSKNIRDQLNDFMANNIINLLTVSMEIKKSAWLQNCTFKNLSSFQISNVFKLRLLTHLNSSHDILFKSFFKLTQCLLRKSQKESNSEELNDQIKLFCIKIIEEIFVNCRSEKEKIISEYLKLCFETVHASFYIDVLTQLFEKEFIRHKYCESKIEEDKIKIQRIVISRLNGSSKSSPSLLQLDSIQNAVNLLIALKYIMFGFSVEIFSDLVDYFGNNLKNATEKISVCCLATLIKSLNSKESIRNSKEGSSIEQISLRILDILKNFLGISEDAELKSFIYQSFFNIIKLNPKLQNPIANLLLNQLNQYVRVEKKKHIYFDIGICFSNNGSVIKLIEPIDVLFHAITLCSNFHSNEIQPSKNLLELRRKVRSILETYVFHSQTDYLDSIYNSQTLYLTTEFTCVLRQVHQIKLGIIDSLIENCVNNKLLSDILQLISYHDKTSSINTNQIETITRYTKEPEPLSAKRKIGQYISKPSSSKRLKFDDVAKENIIQSKPVLRSKLSTKREPLSNIQNNSQTLKQTTCFENALKTNSSSSSDLYLMIIGDYAPRISLECCVKLIKLTQMTQMTSLNDNKLTEDKDKRNELIMLITNSSLNEYILKTIERKLESIKNIGNFSNGQERSIYDVDSNESKEVFENLLAIWNNFFQRVFTTNEIKSSFKTPLNERTNQNYLMKFQRCLNICMKIWQIVNKNFKNLISKLISNNCKVSFANVQIDISWKFLLDCSNKIEQLIKSTDAQTGLASKCSSILLKMISDVIDVFEFSSEKLSNIKNWLCRISKKNISGDKEMTLTLLQLFVKLANKEFSSCVMIKHLLFDYHNYILNGNIEAQTQNDIEYFQEFKILNEHNCSIYHDFLMNQLEISIKQIKWAVEMNSYFNQTKLLNLICKNLDSLIMSFDYIVKSTSSLKTVNLAFEKTIKFFELLIHFFEVKLSNEPSSYEIRMLKNLYKIIYTNLVNGFESKLNRINEVLLGINQSLESLDIINILSYKKLLTQLLEKISSFENSMCNFFQTTKNNDTINEFMPIRSCINLNFETKITKIISETQFNEIIRRNK